MLFFIQIPRTGGTTLNQLFHLAYGKRHVGFYPPPPGPLRLTTQQHAELHTYFNNAMSFSSTVVRREPVLFEAWPSAKFMTILRDPVERLVSDYLSFFSKYGISSDNIPDYLQSYAGSLQNYSRDNSNQNLMTRYLSGVERETLLESEHLEMAKNALGQVDYVLLCEFFDLTLAPVLVDFPELHQWHRQKLNANPQREDGFEYRSALDGGVIEELTELNRLDMALYQHACNLVAQRLSAVDFRGLFAASRGGRKTQDEMGRPR